MQNIQIPNEYPCRGHFINANYIQSHHKGCEYVSNRTGVSIPSIQVIFKVSEHSMTTDGSALNQSAGYKSARGNNNISLNITLTWL